jgi:hypothetical protein
MTPRERPDVGEMLRPGPEQQQVDRGDAIASAALVIGPVLALAPVITFFVPFLAEGWWILADVLALGLAPAVLSLAWRPGGSATRARTVTIAVAALEALLIGWVGLQANPCAADPPVVALVGAGMTLATFLLASSVGRALASGGRFLAPLVAAGVVGMVGMFVTAFYVLPQVLVLC